MLVYSLHNLASVILEIEELLVGCYWPSDQAPSDLWNWPNDLGDNKIVLVHWNECAHTGKVIGQHPGLLDD